MSFGYNRINYGIHSICPFRISDGLPYGILKVLGGGTMTLSSEFEELFGGSNKFAWAVEAKTISSEWTATVKSMPDFMFELFLGASVQTTAASATGTVGDLANVLNSSVVAATGIASVAAKAGSESDLKDGIYIIKAVSATTVDIYALTDIEFKKLGSNELSYIDESLKINAAPLTIVQSAVVEIPSLGVELTGGAGVIGMTVGDTARFSVRSAHNGISTISIGGGSTIFPEHRQLCLGQKRANGDTFEMELFRVVGSGMPIPFEEQTFAIPELSMKLVQDPCEDKVAVIRAKRGAGGC
jgi:hypothetical protein